AKASALRSPSRTARRTRLLWALRSLGLASRMRCSSAMRVRSAPLGPPASRISICGGRQPPQCPPPPRQACSDQSGSGSCDGLDGRGCELDESFLDLGLGLAFLASSAGGAGAKGPALSPLPRPLPPPSPAPLLLLPPISPSSAPMNGSCSASSSN